MKPKFLTGTFQAVVACKVSGTHIGTGLMSAEEHRRKAQHFLSLARHLTDPHDRAKLVSIAALWNERANEAERRERIEQKQQIEQLQPEKEPEAERS